MTLLKQTSTRGYSEAEWQMRVDLAACYRLADMLMYYLERACKVQMQVLASGLEYRLLPTDVCEAAAGQYDQFPYGKYEWPALLRLVEKRAPDYRD